MADEGNGQPPGLKTERVLTAGMKRRGVVKVLKHALQDAQREVGRDRVTGIFGLVVREDQTVSMLSAVTAAEMRIVIKAVPEAVQACALALDKAARKGRE